MKSLLPRLLYQWSRLVMTGVGAGCMCVGIYTVASWNLLAFVTVVLLCLAAQVYGVLNGGHRVSKIPVTHVRRGPLKGCTIYEIDTD